MKKLFLAAIFAIALFLMAPLPPVQAADLVDGAKIFTANCSACHMGGSNVIITGKTLKKEALEKYHMKSMDAIKYQVFHGKNSMPSFRSRLNQMQIEDVAAYVLNQSEKGW